MVHLIELFRQYVKWKILSHIYWLNFDNRVAAPLKKHTGSLLCSHQNQEKNEKSDIDFLIVASKRKEKFIKAAKRLEELEKEVSLSILKLSEWRSMAKKGDAFYRRIVENHILLYGSGLK